MVMLNSGTKVSFSIVVKSFLLKSLNSGTKVSFSIVVKSFLLKSLNSGTKVSLCLSMVDGTSVHTRKMENILQSHVPRDA